jgi:diacylglycerol kinase family enzyme
MRLLFLANPTAAGRRSRRLLPPLREYLAGKVEVLDYLESESADDLRLKASDAARAGFDRVLAAGGDGTVNAALNGLLGSDTALRRACLRWCGRHRV